MKNVFTLFFRWRSALLRRLRGIWSNEYSHMNNPTNGEIGVGLLPRRNDSEYGVGHMWLYWTNTEGPHHPYRRFYPDYTDIPQAFQHPNRWREYFFTYSVRGRYVVDVRGMELAQRARENLRDKQWPIDHRQKYRLELRCMIPVGQDGVDEGRYSWNEARDDGDNCSSWAIKVVNYVMDDSDFIRCSRPKRLRYVEAAIWSS